jgi:DNA-binding PadR family transcriptional regulator
MWAICNPKADGDLKACAVLGKTLNRLSQPTILTVLAASDKPLHGYVIVQKAAQSPMFGGNKPDATGVYRTLKQMEENGLVTSHWETPKTGPAKRSFKLTDEGRISLRRWIDSLACYITTIDELRKMASEALEIETPPTPSCQGH